MTFKHGMTLTFLHTEHLGSSSVVLDNAGALYSRQTYYLYGKTRTQQGNALPTDFTFTGQRADVGELMDYRAREVVKASLPDQNRTQTDSQIAPPQSRVRTENPRQVPR